ncbi:hypothetical protein QR680_011883 [Steinernema hermaphroditum]|uniref:Uncharacterized protein n=1 Tax=Steinernema hermaphroditum TaxID=289476 RepID=A0AA39LZQ7_9BILA|nr:hypothetical protein QR680_011883 [Steinernema hermaphroditum]
MLLPVVTLAESDKAVEAHAKICDNLHLYELFYSGDLPTIHRYGLSIRGKYGEPSSPEHKQCYARLDELHEEWKPETDSPMKTEVNKFCAGAMHYYYRKDKKYHGIYKLADVNDVLGQYKILVDNYDKLTDNDIRKIERCAQEDKEVWGPLKAAANMTNTTAQTDTNTTETASTNLTTGSPTGPTKKAATDLTKEMPANTTKETPAFPLEEASTNIIKDKPTDPAIAVPTNPATGSPTIPAKEASRNPVTRVPTIPAKKTPTNPMTGAPTNPAKNAYTDPVTAVPTSPATGAPMNPTKKVSVGPVTGVPTIPAKHSETTNTTKAASANPTTGTPTNVTQQAPTSMTKKAPVNPSTEGPRILTKEVPTDPVTAVPTNPAREARTYPTLDSATNLTEAVTTNSVKAANVNTDARTKPAKETPTTAAKKASTDPVTGAPTNPVTGVPTIPMKEAPTDAATGAPTNPANEAPTNPAKEAPADPATAVPTILAKEAPTYTTLDSATNLTAAVTTNPVKAANAKTVNETTTSMVTEASTNTFNRSIGAEPPADSTPEIHGPLKNSSTFSDASSTTSPLVTVNMTTTTTAAATDSTTNATKISATLPTGAVVNSIENAALNNGSQLPTTTSQMAFSTLTLIWIIVPILLVSVNGLCIGYCCCGKRIQNLIPGLPHYFKPTELPPVAQPEYREWLLSDDKNGLMHVCVTQSSTNHLQFVKAKYENNADIYLPAGDFRVLFEIIDAWKENPGAVLIHLTMWNAGGLPEIEGFKKRESTEWKTIYTCVVRDERGGHCCFLEHCEVSSTFTVKCLF